MMGALIVFAKYPIPGEVKTRLGKDIGNNEASLLYAGMLRVLFKELTPLTHHIYPYVGQSEYVSRFQEMFCQDINCFAQSDGDLGARMKNAFLEVFEKYSEPVIVLGSDVPTLTRPIVEHAFKQLELYDAVIGPSEDGGYYLLGFRPDTFIPGCFEGIKWSTHTVYDDTMALLDKAEISVGTLSLLDDIDDVSDLSKLDQNILEELHEKS